MTHFVDILTHFLTSWLTFSLDLCRSDCILSLFREQNIMKTCFWCYTELFDVMACFWCHDVIAYFWLYDKLFDIMTYIDFISNFWHMFDAMTCFWRHHVFLMSWQTFWRHGESFDAMRYFYVANFLTLWRTFWGYDVINISWQHNHNTQPNTYKYIRMMMWSDFVGSVSRYPKAYTQPLCHNPRDNISRWSTARLVTNFLETLWAYYLLY